jgi:hypothetical protein
MGKIIEPHHSLDTISLYVRDHMARALRQKSHPFRAFCLATAVAGGADARLVILRKLTHRPFECHAYTDARSDKMAQLREQPMAALHFWHHVARLQVVVQARAVVHHCDAVSTEAWQQVGADARAEYNAEPGPGSTLVDPERWQKHAVRAELSPNDFAVLRFIAVRMDVLQLRREGHIRATFHYREGVQYDAAFVVP